MSKQLTKITAISFSIFAVLISLIFFLNFDISQKVEKIEKLRGEIYFRSKSTDNLAILQTEYSQIQPYLPDLGNFLPSRDQLINFSKDMNALALQNNVSFSSNFSNENKSPNDISSIDVSITTDGAFENIVNFIKAMEGSHYSINFNSIDFSSKTKDFRILLNGKVYYF